MVDKVIKHAGMHHEFWLEYNSKFHLLFVKPLEDPKKTTDIILEALKDTGQRGIIDKGWGDLGNCKFLSFCNELSCFGVSEDFLKVLFIVKVPWIGLK